MTTPLQVRVAQAIADLSLNGLAFKLPLYRAVGDRIINLSQPARDAMPPFKELERAGLPAVVLVSDDDYASTGPAGWAASNRLRYWLRGAMLHGTGGKEADYLTAVVMAQACRRLVLIETDSLHLEAWADLIRSAPVVIPAILLRPSRPGPHPTPLTKGQVQ